MKLNKITLLLSATLLSMNISAANIESQGDIQKENIVKYEKIDKNETIKSILTQETFAKRYILLKGYASTHKDLTIKIKKDDKEYDIPLLSYLLLEGFEEESIKLVKEKILTSFVEFEYMENQYNDLLIAILNNQNKYFEVAVKLNKKELNKQFNFNNEEGYYLFMAVAEVKSIRSSFFTRVLLENGASPYLQTKNGHTAESLAAFKSNNYFLEELHHFENQQSKNEIKLNSPLPYKDKIKQQKIVENLNAGLIEEISKDFNKMKNQWITLIILGYNDAAEIIYAELVKNEKFDITTPNDKGINALMAAAMSSVPSGNIEYALKLIERGIDIKFESNDTRAIDIVVVKDSYKLLIPLMKAGENFLTNKEGEYLFEIAMRNKAFKSAYILKETAKELSNVNGK
jgi:ankyrin repeat protein